MEKVRAVRIVKAGGPEMLELGEITLGPPGRAEVRVRVAAAGLNRADCLQRRGFYPPPPGVPADVPGLEFAGVVETVGEGVSGWAPGDRVMGIVGGGAMATHVLTSADEVVRVPAPMSLEEAAAVPEVFFTAYDAVTRQAGLGIGETLLVHAVASGVGTAAIQLAKAAGAISIGTSRTADKLERCAALGLDHGVLVSDKRFAEQVLAVAPAGADVILDTIGAAYLGENLQALATRGRVVVIGLMGGVKGELSLGALLAKRGQITGSVLRSRSAAEKATLTQAFAHHVLPLFERGLLKPVIDDVLPMSDIQAAHQRMESNETFGKLVMRWA